MFNVSKKTNSNWPKIKQTVGGMKRLSTAQSGITAGEYRPPPLGYDYSCRASWPSVPMKLNEY